MDLGMKAAEGLLFEQEILENLANLQRNKQTLNRKP